MMKNLVVSSKAAEVINLARKAVSVSPTGVSFFHLLNYKSTESGEVANHLINVGVSYENAVAKDINFLASLDVRAFEWKSPITDIEFAKSELLASLIKPNQNRSEGQKDAYTVIMGGVKVHNETGLLYVFGYSVKKEVLVEGTYKQVKSSSLTIAKNEIRKFMKSTKYRQFKIDVGNQLKCVGETVEI